MNKPKFKTPDLTSQNIDKIAALFPNCVTEMRDENGKLKRAVNFEMLKQMLSPDVVDGDECYEFTWVGKKAAIVEANKPIRKTLRPCPEESKDWDTTENLYIEGDNLEVLKLLQEAYLGKVKMIYIDPPYNTGHDFVYPDSFIMDNEEYNDGLGYYDENGNVNFSRENARTAGKYHSDWCSMMYSRLMLARNLLAEDGVIFISIDDKEVENLKKICNEIFGDNNFEGHIHWRRRHNQPNDKTKMIGIVAEHIIVYAKNSAYLKSVGVGKLDLTANFTNADNDPKGPWASKPWKVGSDQSGSRYTIVTPTGKIIDGEWMGEEATYKKYLAEGRIYFPKGGDGMPRKKYYQFEREAEGQCATNWWPHEQFGNNQGANDQMTELFGIKNIFSNPKPIELVRAMIKIANVKDSDICLDFFSGSATTAHTVMQLNAEERQNLELSLENLDKRDPDYQAKFQALSSQLLQTGKRKFIMVQLPEPCDEKSEAYKAGYQNICEIGKERIRRAGEKIKEENPQTAQDLDIGFRVLKLDDSNMKDVYYAADEYDQKNLEDMVSNIKEDRTDLDLLFGCLLDWGLPLSMSYQSEQIDGCTVHTYNDGDLIACFDKNIPENVVKEIAKRKPLRAVFRDSSFADSPSKINVFEIFKLYMPEDANDISKRVRVI